MTDIVARLRDWPRMTPAACKEAADEIERLMSEREAMQAAIATLKARSEEYANEIEQLRAALQGILDIGDASSGSDWDDLTRSREIARVALKEEKGSGCEA